MLAKLRKILGAITDLLLVGRNNGWWNRKGPQGPSDKGNGQAH